jgi:short subunit dehydrogenase
MPGLVQGKIALVTGDGSGIGRATGLKLAKEGAKVMIADYVPEGGERKVRMIEEAGEEASFVAADSRVIREARSQWRAFGVPSPGCFGSWTARLRHGQSHTLLCAPAESSHELPGFA